MPSKGQTLKPGNKSYVSGCTRERLGCRLPGAKLPTSPGMMGEAQTLAIVDTDHIRKTTGHLWAEQRLEGTCWDHQLNQDAAVCWSLQEQRKRSKTLKKEAPVTQKMVRTTMGRRGQVALEIRRPPLKSQLDLQVPMWLTEAILPAWASLFSSIKWT